MNYGHGACYLLTNDMSRAFDESYDGLWSQAEATLKSEGDAHLAKCCKACDQEVQTLSVVYRNQVMRKINHQMRLLLQNPQTDFFGFESDSVFHETLAFIIESEARMVRSCCSPEELLREIVGRISY